MHRGSMVLLVIVAALFAYCLSALWPGRAPAPQLRLAPAAQPEAAAAPPGGGPELVAQGKNLANVLGCVACHTVNGQPSVGPTWKRLAGSQRKLENGDSVAADDAYLRESISAPDAKIVAGFPKGVMSAALGPHQSRIGEPATVDALLAYMNSLK